MMYIAAVLLGDDIYFKILSKNGTDKSGTGNNGTNGKVGILFTLLYTYNNSSSLTILT